MDKKYLQPRNEIEEDHLYNELDNLNGRDLTKSQRLQLGEIVINTDNRKLCYIIGHKYVEYMQSAESIDEAYLPNLIKYIEHNIHTDYLDTFVYLCSHFDCSKHLMLFTDILMVKSNLSFYSAGNLIMKMKSIEERDRAYAINKLKAFLKFQGEEYELKRAVEQVIEYLKFGIVP